MTSSPSADAVTAAAAASATADVESAPNSNRRSVVSSYFVPPKTDPLVDFEPSAPSYDLVVQVANDEEYLPSYEEAIAIEKEATNNNADYENCQNEPVIE